MTDTAAAHALVAAARSAIANAHAPYSRFAVGAAVRLTDGTVVTGCNFENASYGLSLCAETATLAAVGNMGRLADVEAIAVAGGPMAPAERNGPGAVVHPCGRCRQMLVEVEQLAGRPISIHCADAGGAVIQTHGLADLLPHAFGPADIGVDAPAQKDA